MANRLAQPTPTRYRVDYPRLAWLLLPALLRRPRLVALVQWLTTPVLVLYARFAAYEAQVRRELSYNSQVLLFEAALNDRFDAGVRRIYITNSDVELQPLYVNFQAEQQAQPVLYFQVEHHQPPTCLYQWLEFSSQVDFVVHAPAVLRPRAGQLHALIRRLKLANKHYQLIFY